MDDDFFLPFESKYGSDNHSIRGRDREGGKDTSGNTNRLDSCALQPNNVHKVEVVPRPKRKIEAAWSKHKKVESNVASDSDVNEKVEEQEGCLKSLNSLLPEALKWSDEENGPTKLHTKDEDTQQIELKSPTRLVTARPNECAENLISPTNTEIENPGLVQHELMVETGSSRRETQAISDKISNLDTLIRKKQPAKREKRKTATKKSNTVPKIAEAVKTFVKKARVFQVHRITRRIALLRKKKGDCQQLDKNERKIKRMLEHIDLLKNINLDVYSENIAKCLVEGIKSHRTPQDEVSGYQWLETGLIERQIESMIVEKLLKMDIFLKYLETLLPKQDISTDKMIDREKTEQSNGENNTIETGIENDSEEEESDIVKSIQRTEVIKKKRMSKHDSKGANAKRMKSGDKKTAKLDSLEEHAIDGNVECKEVTVGECMEVGEEKHVLIATILPENRKQKTASVINKQAKNRNEINVSKPADFKANTFDKKKMAAKNKKTFADVLRKVQGTRGNRLGQRARRELWEKMFGSEAIHVKRGEKLKRRPKQRGQADVRNKKARDTDKKKGFEGLRKKVKIAKEAENLHPSWQAKRVQKHQTQIVEFKGNKVTFDE